VLFRASPRKKVIASSGKPLKAVRICPLLYNSR
jgi:hypothetical protein